MSGWLRINDTMDEDDALLDLAEEHGPIIWAVWIVVLCQAKRRGHRGVVNVSPKRIGRSIGASGDEVDSALECLASTGLIKEVTVTSVSNKRVEIASWSKFQEDPTNAERQSRFRANSQTESQVTVHAVSNGNNADGTGLKEQRARAKARTRNSTNPADYTAAERHAIVAADEADRQERQRLLREADVERATREEASLQRVMQRVAEIKQREDAA